MKRSHSRVILVEVVVVFLLLGIPFLTAGIVGRGTAATVSMRLSPFGDPNGSPPGIHPDTGVASVVATVSVGPKPDTEVYDTKNGDMYVVSQGDDTVSVINGSTYRVVATIAVGNYPQGEAYDPANGYVYVNNDGSENVSVIDGSNNQVIASVALPGYPQGIAVDPSTGNVYVTDWSSSQLTVINGSTQTVITNVPVGGYPHMALLDSASEQVFVPNQISGTVSAVNLATLAVTTISVDPNPWNACLDGVTDQLWVGQNPPSGSSNVIQAINATTDSVVSTQAVGTSHPPCTADPINGNVYVAGSGGNVTVLSRANDAPIASIPVGDGPGVLIFDQASGDFVLPNANSNNVSIIDPSTNTVVESLSVGTTPSAYDYGADPYDPVTGDVFVSNYGSSNVSVISFAKSAPAPSLSVVSISPGSSGLASGATQSFSARAVTTTGTPLSTGVSYSWSFSPPSLGTLNTTGGSSVTFTASSAKENGTLFVNATYQGLTREATASISATGAPTTSSTSSSLSPLEIGLIAAVALVAAAAAAVVLLSRKKRGGSGQIVSSPPPPPPPPS